MCEGKEWWNEYKHAFAEKQDDTNNNYQWWSLTFTTWIPWTLNGFCTYLTPTHPQALTGAMFHQLGFWPPGFNIWGMNCNCAPVRLIDILNIGFYMSSVSVFHCGCVMYMWIYVNQHKKYFLKQAENHTLTLYDTIIVFLCFFHRTLSVLFLSWYE